MAGVFARRIAVVTGGASGIGRAAAVMLASKGAAVVAVDRDWEGRDVTAAEMGTGHIVQLAADVADVDVSTKRLLAYTISVLVFFFASSRSTYT